MRFTSTRRKNKTLTLLVTFILFASCQKADAATLFFNAVDKGWWSNNLANGIGNENYYVGTVRGTDHRNFFSFDLTALNAVVTSARLEVTAFLVEDLLKDPYRYDLYDVTTPIPILNDTDLGLNLSIYNDLGSGVDYASHPINIADGYYPDLILSFGLNNNAISAINTAAGSQFAVGGSLSSIANVNRGLFGLSDTGGVQRLVLETDTPQNNPNAVPEPASMILLGSGLFGAFLKKRLS